MKVGDLVKYGDDWGDTGIVIRLYLLLDSRGNAPVDVWWARDNAVYTEYSPENLEVISESR